MTIEFKPGRYIHGVWFVCNNNMDWMGCLWQDKGGKWTFTYRHRYYVDTKAHDSDDVKHWYTAELSVGSAKEAAKQVEVLAELVAKKMPMSETMPLGEAQSHYVAFECDGGDPSIAEKFKAAPWMHSKTLTKDEAKSAGLL